MSEAQLITALPTPFTADEQLDTDGLTAAAIAAKAIGDIVAAEGEELPVEVVAGAADEAAVADAAAKTSETAKRNQTKTKSNKGKNRSKKKRKY